MGKGTGKGQYQHVVQDDEMFRKRAGTTDRGKIYETLVCAQLALQLGTNKDVENFKLSSNDEDYGKFDDIILEMESNGNTELFAFQLKHSKKNLNIQNLQGSTGDFSIEEYYKSFQKIKKRETCKYVIYTNRPFSVDENSSILELCGRKVKIVKVNKHDCYQLVPLEKAHSEKHNTFFENLLICTNQPNDKNVREDILVSFQKKFSCEVDSGEKFINFVSEWSLREGRKEKLTKGYIQKEIALILLTPCIKELSFGYVDDKMKILRNAISQFDITILNVEHYDDVKMIWGDFKEEFFKRNKAERKNLKNRYQIYCSKDNFKEIPDIVLSKYLWLMGECPLIVTESDVTYKAIALCPEQKFILLKSKMMEKDLPPVKILRGLSDLETLQSFQDIKETFKCSLQGKEEVSLNDLIEQNEKFASLISTNELMKMLRGSFRIGEGKHPLQQPYISRSCSRNLIDIRYIDKVNKKHVVVLDCMNKLDLIKTKLGNFNLMRVNIFLREESTNRDAAEVDAADSGYRKLFHSSPILKKFVAGPDLYVSDDHCSLIEFERVCENITAKRRVENQTAIESCHYLRIVDAETLEWIRSRGDISGLEDCRKTGSPIKETTFFASEPDNNINLIDGDPGLGKSELLKNIKNNSSTKVWGILFDSKEIALLCKILEREKRDERETKFVDFILNTKYKDFYEFDKMVVKMYIEKKKVAYFWDALDELHTEDFELITNFIGDLSEKCSYQWITSRCHLKKRLEEKFKVLSRNVCQFNENEQLDYIHRRLDHLNSEKKLTEVIEKIQITVGLVKHDVLGIPLQIFMLTELFRQDFDKYYEMLTNVFSLTDLYQHIIDEKFNTYYKEKADVHSPNKALAGVLKAHKKLMFENYEKAGLKALIQKELFKELNINVDDLSNEFEEDADTVGLITEMTNNFPQFLHNSYAEFFVASYFKDHPKEIEAFEKIIYDKKYANIRFFFDLLTAKDKFAHIAVLYKNLEFLKDELKKSKTDLKNSEDSNGRNVLELASSWGHCYPVLATEKFEEGYIIDNDNDNSSTGENSDYMEMLNYILDNVSEDNQKSSLSVAAKANCLLAKIGILLKQKKKLDTLGDTNETISIVYYSIKFGYPEVVSLFEKLPFVKTKTDHGSLLHLAIRYEKEECLRKLLETKVYAKAINDKNNYGYTPLIQACQSGYYNLVKVLLESGADPNCEGFQGTTALHTACLHAHEKVVELLLKPDAKIKADVNKTKDFDITPLHATCWNGHESVVKILLKNEANINARTEGGCTSLYVASRNKHNKVVKILLESGADVNLPQNQQVTPLLIASQEGHIENVKLLLQKGAAVNCVTTSGETPLYMASQNGHEETVEELLEYGAAVNFHMNDVWSPLQIAVQQGHCKVVEMLLKKGANTDVGKEDGATPLYIAEHHGRDTIIPILRSYIKN